MNCQLENIGYVKIESGVPRLTEQGRIALSNGILSNIFKPTNCNANCLCDFKKVEPFYKKAV